MGAHPNVSMKVINSVREFDGTKDKLYAVVADVTRSFPWTWRVVSDNAGYCELAFFEQRCEFVFGESSISLPDFVIGRGEWVVLGEAEDGSPLVESAAKKEALQARRKCLTDHMRRTKEKVGRYLSEKDSYEGRTRVVIVTKESFDKLSDSLYADDAWFD